MTDPGGEPLFVRAAANPIISPRDLPYNANAVFNPAPPRSTERRSCYFGSRICGHLVALRGPQR